MKNLITRAFVLAITGLSILSCGDKKTGGTEPLPDVMDNTVVGKWQGTMPPISFANFNGESIFADINDRDSAFALVTKETGKDSTKNPEIKDTTLVLSGTWRLNQPKDSILLICSSCRIIDTAKNILVSRSVAGQIIPILITIAQDQSTSKISWEISLADLGPLAPLLGLNLTGYPASFLQVIKVTLYKTSQH